MSHNNSADADRDSSRRLVLDAVLADGFRRATFSGVPRTKPSPWQRVVLRPVELRGGERYVQFSYFDQKKDTTKNARGQEVLDRLDELLAFGYSGIHLSSGDEEIDVRTTRKGQVQVGRRRAEVGGQQVPAAHNRAKNVPLPEGQPDRLLEVMGVLTPDGRVRPTMRAKFTQINECLKLLAHLLDEAGLRSLGREVEILDAGCGSSYLTLAVHHYLKDVLGIPARVLGVDVNEEVIRKSTERSQRCGAAGEARFAVGRIGAVEARPDLVMALHACDTATDDALAVAVHREARAVLCAPCCHHHLNEQVRAEGPAAPLRPILRHGILKQRLADVTTDAFRALALRVMGYQSDVIEFISPEHTARNLMIRAVRKGAAGGDAAAVREYLEMRRFWGVTPYIEQALGEPFGTLVGLQRRTLPPRAPGQIDLQRAAEQPPESLDGPPRVG